MTPARVIAIDPGPVRSAWLMLADGKVVMRGIDPNEVVRSMCRGWGSNGNDITLVIEQVESFGMAVGKEVFETVRWAGRFEEAAQPLQVVLMPRRTVKLHLCNSAKAKDTNIRQALLDRFGGSAAVGKKAAPGPLYGIANDVWSALAIAVTYSDSVLMGAA